MVERGLTNTLDTVQNYLALIRQNKRRLDMRTGPESIQIYREVSAFIHSCQFYLKSMPLSEVNLVMLENRAIALQGLILLNKKMRRWYKRRTEDFFEANYIDYIHYNVVQEIERKIDQVLFDITKINLHNLEHGIFTRNNSGHGSATHICHLRHRSLRGLS